MYGSRCRRCRIPGSPRSRLPGLTIHLLSPDDYGPAAVSRVFTGWSAAEIHRALDEDALSGETAAVPPAGGRAMAEPAGADAGPDDDPFPSAAPGDSRRAIRAEAVREILDARKVPRSPGFTARLETFADLPVSVLARAALACRDEEDFLRRLAAARRCPPGGRAVRSRSSARRARTRRRIQRAGILAETASIADKLEAVRAQEVPRRRRRIWTAEGQAVL